MRCIIRDVIRLTILLVTLYSGQAEGRRGKTIEFLLHLSADYLTTNSDGDKIANATYAQKFTHPYVAGAGVGASFFQLFYLGVKYEYWFGIRQFSLNSVEQKDVLNHQTAGVETGLYFNTPRVFFLLLGSANYPIATKVASTSGGTTTTYENSSAALAYHARLAMGIRFFTFLSFYLETQYRFSNLGQLSAGGTNYLDGSLDLSGPSAGLGILINF